MNKTLTVNIGGIVFHIEEQAYETLKKYLDAIRSHFTTGDGRDEIMQDIESRIAEMFTTRIGTTRQVVEVADVEYVQQVMGKPEQYDDGLHDDTIKNNDPYQGYVPPIGSRKMYRDEDDKMIAGVCAGLAHKFNVDATWIRLAFVALFFFGTGGFWLYIILWIAMPKAITSAQKIEMRGEQVNIESLKKNYDASMPLARSGVQRTFDTVFDVIKALLKAFAYLIAIAFGFAAIGILIALFTSILGVAGIAGITMPFFISDMFIDKSQQYWSALALALVIGIPVFYGLYKIVKWIFKINTSYPWVQFTALTLWIVGLVIAAWMTVDIMGEFSQYNEKRVTTELNIDTSDTLNINLLTDNESQDYGTRGRRYHIGFFDMTWNYKTGEEKYIVPGNVEMDVQRALGDKFELVQIASARGRTARQAYENAVTNNYIHEQRGNNLFVSEGFTISKGQRFRDQRIALILKVPVGKTIFLSEPMKSIVYDIKNVTDTWDWEMVGHYWKMTDRGLECVDHDFRKSSDNDDSENNIEEIDLNGDTKVNIGRNGITISKDGDTLHARDVDINIDQNGIKIKKAN